MSEQAQSTKDEVTSEPKPIILENWFRYGTSLHGNVYGHPRFHDGDEVTTSEVVELLEDIGVAKTRNTVYVLRNKRAQ